MAIKRPYSEHAITFSAADITNWQSYTYVHPPFPLPHPEDKHYKFSPMIDVTQLVSPLDGITTGNEINNIKIQVNYASESGSAHLLVGVMPEPMMDLNEVLKGWQRWEVGQAAHGKEYGPYTLDSYWRERKALWVILEEPVPIVESITIKFWVGYGTRFGHEMDGAGEFLFANAKFWYGISFPKNYDSSNPKQYPLCISTSGDNTQGCDGIASMQVEAMWGSYLAGKWYNRPEYECFSVVYQMPDNYCLKDADPPYNTSGMNLGVGKWTSMSFRGFIEYLLAHPDVNVDPNRIYASGFSRGASQTWVNALDTHDLLATIVTCYENRNSIPMIMPCAWAGVQHMEAADKTYLDYFDHLKKQWVDYFPRLGHLNMYRFYEKPYLTRDWPNGFHGDYVELENQLFRDQPGLHGEYTAFFTNGDHQSTHKIGYGDDYWMGRIFRSRKARSIEDIILDWSTDADDSEKQRVAQLVLSLKEALNQSKYGDINLDGIVDSKDLAALAKNWMKRT